MSLQAYVWSFAELWRTDVDLTGFTVEARDGRLGTVDHAAREGMLGYLIVDTAPWHYGTQEMLPGGVVRRVDLDTETVFVDRTKDEIMNAPEFDEDRAPDAGYHEELTAYYGAGGRGE